MKYINNKNVQAVILFIVWFVSVIVMALASEFGREHYSQKIDSEQMEYGGDINAGSD